MGSEGRSCLRRSMTFVWFIGIAPPLEEVSVEVRQPGLTGKSVQAKGTYLSRVCKLYKEHFSHGRRFRKARTQRREKGTQRDEKKLEKMSRKRSARARSSLL